MSDWDGTWAELCGKTVAQFWEMAQAGTLDDAIELAAKDLLDNALLKLGEPWEALSDQLVGQLGGVLFGLVKPMIESGIEGALSYKPLESLAHLTGGES